MKKNKTKSYDEFADKYNLVTNHIIPDAPNEGTMFETYGKELDFILNTARRNPKHVWTIVDGDNDETYVIAGCHYVNRVGYLITTEPWKRDTEIYRYD